MQGRGGREETVAVCAIWTLCPSHEAVEKSVVTWSLYPYNQTEVPPSQGHAGVTLNTHTDSKQHTTYSLNNSFFLSNLQR